MAPTTILVFCSSLFAFLLQPAASLRKSRSTQNASASCSAGGFCGCSRAGSDYDRSRQYYIWSAEDVQVSVRNYYMSAGARCQPHSAYAVAYAAMTEKRDEARCSSGPMKPDSAIATKLNDALSDLMTRYFVNIASGTAGGADIDGLWADMRDDAERGNWNSLRYAMASTAIYLTTHMGLALSALPHADELWSGTPYSTISERAGAMRDLYKDAYDSFNAFLAANVNTIADALWEAGLVSNRNINIAAALVPGGEYSLALYFGNIRDKTFNLGVQAAEEFADGGHPLTQRYGSSSILATSASIPGSLVGSRGSAIYELAEHARFWRIAMGDSLGPVYNALGGLTYRDLREGGTRNNACQEALR